MVRRAERENRRAEEMRGKERKKRQMDQRQMDQRQVEIAPGQRRTEDRRWNRWRRHEAMESIEGCSVHEFIFPEHGSIECFQLNS
jgi:hypothetical protein